MERIPHAYCFICRRDAYGQLFATTTHAGIGSRWSVVAFGWYLLEEAADQSRPKPSSADRTRLNQLKKNANSFRLLLKEIGIDRDDLGPLTNGELMQIAEVMVPRFMAGCTWGTRRAANIHRSELATCALLARMMAVVSSSSSSSTVE